MTEEMIKKFSYEFCSDGSYEYLLKYIEDGKPLDQLQNIHWQMTLDVWLEVNSITKEDIVSWLKNAVEHTKQIDDKLAEADKLLAQCEDLARKFKLHFSMPRVSGVSFGPSEYGSFIGWDRSDYSC